MKELCFSTGYWTMPTVNLEGKQIHRVNPDCPQCSARGNRSNCGICRWRMSQPQHLAALSGRQTAEVWLPAQRESVCHSAGREAQGLPDSGCCRLSVNWDSRGCGAAGSWSPSSNGVERPHWAEKSFNWDLRKTCLRSKNYTLAEQGWAN